MEISVVIPTYRRPDLLTTCLRCLEKQTISLAMFEVVVVSDGYDSVTETSLNEFINQSPLRITYLHTATKKCPAAARNLGWKFSSAALIAFTDDDCRPEPGWLSAYLEHYRNEMFIVYSGFTKVPVPEKPTDFALNTRHLQFADFITANCACTRQALLLVEGFDERFRTAWREDSDIEFRFIESRIPIHKVKSAVVTHPVRQAPWGVSIKEQKKGLYDALLYKKHPDLYRKRIQKNPLWNYYAIVTSSVILALALIRADYMISAISAGILILLLLIFFIKRILPASKSPSHIAEMLVTSMVIPFISIYWRFYGAVKYRVFFI